MSMKFKIKCPKCDDLIEIEVSVFGQVEMAVEERHEKNVYFGNKKSEQK
jgi:hypothetical protein